MTRALTFIVLVAAALGAAGHEFFNDATAPCVPAQLRAFVNRYLTARIGETESERNDKMWFDGVTVTFTLNGSSAERLRQANALSLTLDNGRQYTIVWGIDSTAIGSMAFPASHTLITGLGKTAKFRQLTDRLVANMLVTADSLPARQTGRPAAPEFVVTEPGVRFNSGYMTSDAYIEAVTAHPVWSPYYLPESLINLFMFDRMPPVRLGLTVSNGNRDKVDIATTVQSADCVLRLMDGCTVYGGLSGYDPDTGEVNAVIVYHSEPYAYIHKLEVTATADSLFNADRPSITAIMHPYIPLNNVRNLWADQPDRQ